MTAARVIVWRHGRTEWNLGGRFQGQADVALDVRGMAQARVAAEVLATYAPTAIVSSDLARAWSTASALAAVTGLTVRADPRLREIHVGSWEGLTWDQVQATDPEDAAKLRRGEDVRRSASGESVAEAGERAAAALAEAAEGAADGSTVVVTTHGTAGRAGICRFVGLPVQHWNLLGSLDNCAWAVLERHRGGGYYRIGEYNVAGSASVRETIS